jgi:hypothetical protein
MYLFPIVLDSLKFDGLILQLNGFSFEFIL